MTTLEKLKELMVAETLIPFADGLTPETRFREDLHLDSLDKIELLLAVERAFAIDIDDDAADQIQTIAQAVAAIDDQISCQGGRGTPKD